MKLRGWVVPLLFLSTLCFAAVPPANSPQKIIQYALDSEPPQLNSMKSTDSTSIFILGHVMEGLTRIGKSGDIVPGVAEEWTLTDKSATFYLRKDAKWSDGKPVTAKDFIFAWQTAVDPKTASEYAFILYPVKNAETINKGKLAPSQLGVIAPDDHTLKITFEKSCGYFLGLTAFVTYMPAREDFYSSRRGRYAADAQDLLFNGPFMLTQWVHGSSLRMEKNPHYWNRSKIEIDQINVPYITQDNNALFNFYKDGKTDILKQLNRDDLLKAQAERFRMKNFSEGTLWYLEFNFREGRPTRSKNLRKAIQAVFNADEFVSKVVQIPGTKPGTALVPSWLKGEKDLFRKEFPVASKKPDLTEAKKYLEAAKKELGVSQIPSLVLLVDDKPAAGREAEYLQSLLKTTLGLDIKIDRQIFKQRLAKMTAGDFDIVNAGWGPDFNDPMTYAELKASWNENNRGKYSNPEYDKLIRTAQSTSNQKIRMDSMAKAEKIALEDVAILPTYERTVLYVHREKVQGIVRNVIGPDPDFTHARIVTQ